MKRAMGSILPSKNTYIGYSSGVFKYAYYKYFKSENTLFLHTLYLQAPCANTIDVFIDSWSSVVIRGHSCVLLDKIPCEIF